MTEGFIPKAPGMKYRHYAPKAEMILFKKNLLSDQSQKANEISYGEEKKLIAEAILSYGEKEFSVSPERKIWILCGEDTASLYEGDGRFTVQILGRREEPLSMTHNLFRLLRQADEDGAELILGECYSEEGVGFALMNRLKKAAGQRIFYV